MGSRGRGNARTCAPVLGFAHATAVTATAGQFEELMMSWYQRCSHCLLALGLLAYDARAARAVLPADHRVDSVEGAILPQARNSSERYHLPSDMSSASLQRALSSSGSHSDDIHAQLPESAYFSSRVFDIWNSLVRNHKSDPHKPLFPLDWRDGASATFGVIALFVAAGGGIGGGGVLVPIFILVLGALPCEKHITSRRHLRPNL